MLAGNADLISSGDKRDLPPLDGHGGMLIVTAREAVERLKTKGKASAH